MHRACKIGLAIAALAWAAGCNGFGVAKPKTNAAGSATASRDQAPPPQETGGFDGQRAYEYTAKLVSFGPRPPGSDAIHRAQDYLVAQLQADACAVDQDDFHASAPMGSVAMKNILAKIPGETNGVILLLTHYDTLRLPNFVGAVDGGSSTGLMLEMASVLCGHKQPLAVWIGFLDGEEDQANFTTAQQAQTTWSNDNSTYGSREMAARFENSGKIKRLRAVILADMVGPKHLRILRESSSTPWLTDLVWSTAARLGYQKYFLPDSAAIEDDHQPFLARGVPAVDIIDLLDYQREGYWHTTADTMDKVSPKSLAIVGHVILETVRELEKKKR